MEIKSNPRLAHVLVQSFKDQLTLHYEARALGLSIRPTFKPRHAKKGLSRSARSLFI